MYALKSSQENVMNVACDKLMLNYQASAWFVNIHM